jgi:hypothetical protein
VTIGSILRALRRKLTPPGNRGAFDTEYQQPGGQPMHVASPIPPTER